MTIRHAAGGITEEMQEDTRMSLKEQMETGKVYVEFGHADPADQACEQQL